MLPRKEAKQWLRRASQQLSLRQQPVQLRTELLKDKHAAEHLQGSYYPHYPFSQGIASSDLRELVFTTDWGSSHSLDLHLFYSIGFCRDLPYAGAARTGHLTTALMRSFARHIRGKPMLSRPHLPPCAMTLQKALLEKVKPGPPTLTMLLPSSSASLYLTAINAQNKPHIWQTTEKTVNIRAKQSCLWGRQGGKASQAELPLACSDFQAGANYMLMWYYTLL